MTLTFEDDLDLWWIQQYGKSISGACLPINSHLNQTDTISVCQIIEINKILWILTLVAMETAFYRNAQGAQSGTRRIRILHFLYI